MKDDGDRIMFENNKQRIKYHLIAMVIAPILGAVQLWEFLTEDTDDLTRDAVLEWNRKDWTWWFRIK